jgi:hypothetical protein
MTSVTIRQVLMALVAFGLCACSKQNCPSDVAPGDQFRITINTSLAGDTPCDLMLLHPGDSFILTAADSNLKDPNTGCSIYPATTAVPSFARGVLNLCTPAPTDLALACHGNLHGCELLLQSSVSPLPNNSQRVVEHAILTNMASSGVTDWKALDGGVCLPDDCAWDQYDVTVEKITP